MNAFGIPHYFNLAKSQEKTKQTKQKPLSFYMFIFIYTVSIPYWYLYWNYLTYSSVKIRTCILRASITQAAQHLEGEVSSKSSKALNFPDFLIMKAFSYW